MQVFESSLGCPYHREVSDGTTMTWAVIHPLHKYTTPSTLSPNPKPQSLNLFIAIKQSCPRMLEAGQILIFVFADLLC